MVGSKKAALLILATFLFLSFTGAIDFNIEVSEVTSYGSYGANFSESTSSFQNYNVAVENLGSIGCRFRLKGKFNKSGEIETEYSQEYPLWPGEAKTLELEYMPLNHTGNVNSTIIVEYCGQAEKLESFQFNMTERKKLTGRSIDSDEIEANSTSARTSLEVQEGKLVPLEAPPGWKVPTAEIEDSMAKVKYDAPLFKDEHSLKYAVADSSGELIGTTEVELDVEPSLFDKIRQNIWKILLGISIILNFLFFSRSDALKQKLNL